MRFILQDELRHALTKMLEPAAGLSDSVVSLTETVRYEQFQKMLQEFFENPTFNLVDVLLGDLPDSQYSPADLMTVLRYQISAQYRDIGGAISRGNIDVNLGALRNSVELFFTDQITNLNGLPFNKFFIAHLYALYEIYYELLDKPKILGGTVTSSYYDVLRLLEREMTIAVNAYILRRDYINSESNDELSGIVKGLLTFLSVLPNGMQFVVPCGFKGHAIYLLLRKIDDHIHVNVHNAGDGSEYGLGGRGTDGKITLPYLGCFNPSDKDLDLVVQYFTNVFLVELDRKDKSDALPVIYDSAPFNSWGVHQTLPGTSAVEPQTQKNCVVYNYRTGMRERFLKYPGLFDWLYKRVADQVSQGHSPSVSNSQQEMEYAYVSEDLKQAEIVRRGFSMPKNPDWSTTEHFPGKPNDFIDRVVIDTLDATLLATKKRELTAVVFHGSSGSGKTTLAKALADKVKSDFSIFIFATLTPGKNLLLFLRELAKGRKLFPERCFSRDELLIDAWREYLSAQSESILILLDALNEDEDKEVLEKILPHVLNGRIAVIVTSWMKTWSDTFRPQLVGLYTRNEAIEYVSQRWHRRFQSQPTGQEIDDLITATFSHPLALRIAMDHLTSEEHGCNIRDYLSKKTEDGSVVHSADDAVKLAWRRFLNTSSKKAAPLLLAHLVFLDFSRLSKYFLEEIIPLIMSSISVSFAIRLLSEQTSFLTRVDPNIFSIHAMLAGLIRTALKNPLDQWEKTLGFILALAERHNSYQDNQKTWEPELAAHVWHMIETLLMDDISKLSARAVRNYIRLTYLFMKHTSLVGGNVNQYSPPLVERLQRFVERGGLDGLTASYAYLMLSSIAIFQEKFEDAIDYGEKALAQRIGYGQEVGIASKLATPYFELGRVYLHASYMSPQKLHYLDFAKQYYDQAERLYSQRRASQTNNLANALGLVFLEKGAFNDLLIAEQYFNEALRLRESEKPVSPTNLAAIKVNLGRVHYKRSKLFGGADVMSELSVAEYWFQASLGYFNDEDRSTYAARAMHNLGRAAFQRARQCISLEEKANMLKRVIDYHRKALRIRQERLPPTSTYLASSYFQLARALLMLGKLSAEKSDAESVVYFREALKLLECSKEIREKKPKCYWYLVKLDYYMALLYDALGAQDNREEAVMRCQAAKNMLDAHRELLRPGDLALQKKLDELNERLMPPALSAPAGQAAQAGLTEVNVLEAAFLKIKGAIDNSRISGALLFLREASGVSEIDFQKLYAQVFTYVERARPEFLGKIIQAGGGEQQNTVRSPRPKRASAALFREPQAAVSSPRPSELKSLSSRAVEAIQKDQGLVLASLFKQPNAEVELDLEVLSQLADCNKSDRCSGQIKIEQQRRRCSGPRAFLS